MANELLNSIKNIEYRVQAVTPSTESHQSFTSVNGESVSVETLANRQFHADLLQVGAAIDITDGTHRTSPVDMQLTIYYPSEGVIPANLYDMILSDAFQLQKQLEDPALYTGTTESPSLNIGLISRKVSNTKITQNETYWALILSLECLVLEQY